MNMPHNTLLEKCRICPRQCGVNRLKGELGYCRTGESPKIYSYSPHHGEEPVLSGTRGSGTIFFSHCNMRCVYCQNYYFSQLDEGSEMSIDGLASVMLKLQEIGCHNINLVSPTHNAVSIAAAVKSAKDKGLRLPIVYNTSGYDLVDTLKSLDGIIDIYMPDMRYASFDLAVRYSDAPGYVEYNRAAVKEMHRQVGDLVIDKDGIAMRGLIIRLLVLPENISGAKDTLGFIAGEVSKNAFLSIMSQYYPTFMAYNFKELSRPIGKGEYSEILDEARRLGLDNGWVQDMADGVDTDFAGTDIKKIGP